MDKAGHRRADLYLFSAAVQLSRHDEERDEQELCYGWEHGYCTFYMSWDSKNGADHTQDLFDTLPDSLNYNVTGWLVYDESADKPAPTDVANFDYFDDYTLVPYDGVEALPDADLTITLDLTMDNLGDGAN